MNKFFNTEKESQSKDELLSNKIDKLQKSLEICFDRLFISYEKPLDEFKEYLNSKNDIRFVEDFTEHKPHIFDESISISYELTIEEKDRRSVVFPDGKVSTIEDAVLKILVKYKLGVDLEYENEVIDEDQVEVQYMTYWYESIDFSSRLISNHKDIDKALEELFSMANRLSK
jgi:hypothetical protein